MKNAAKRKVNPAKLTKDEREDLVSLLGEGFHTAFRKGTYHESAHGIWVAIQKLPRREWASVLDFVMMCVGPYVEDLLQERAIAKAEGSQP